MSTRLLCMSIHIQARPGHRILSLWPALFSKNLRCCHLCYRLKNIFGGSVLVQTPVCIFGLLPLQYLPPFAAIQPDGSVVTWGDPYSGGDSSRVQDEFNYLLIGRFSAKERGHTFVAISVCPLTVNHLLSDGLGDLIALHLLGDLEHFFYFPIYWEEYSQLTNIFQRGWNHQPVLHCPFFGFAYWVPQNRRNHYSTSCGLILYCIYIYILY